MDDGAARTLNRFARERGWFVDAMQAVSDAGSGYVYYPLFILIVLWLLWRRRRRAAAYVTVTMLGGMLLNRLVKAAVGRERPEFDAPVFTADGLAFPSGHAQSAVVACAVLLALSATRSPYAYLAAAVWALLVGFSRVALGVHYVSDVLAGFLLGAIWAAAMTAAFSLAAGRDTRSGPSP